jgi:hypothetical protein
MTDDERQELLQKMEALIEATRKMTPEEALLRLQAEGLCDERGRPTGPYGGEVAA